MRRKKVLLVDDSSTILMMERMILGKEAYDLVTAKDGHEAVAKAVEEKPDLILMDIMMPRMSGLEAFRQIRKVDQKTPIIMVTTGGEGVEAGLASGWSDYVTKPLDGPQLISKLRGYLGE